MEPWVGNKFLLGRKIGSGSFREIYLRPLTQYKALVDQGKLQYDPYQETIASELENLVKKLEQYNKVMEEYHVSLSKWEEIREHERCRILVKEAEVKQEGGAMASVKKWPSRIFENLMSCVLMEKRIDIWFVGTNIQTNEEVAIKLVNNAGLMENNRITTSKGYELNFAVNVLGTYTLTESLMPLLEKPAPESRVITVSSVGMYSAPLTNDMQFSGSRFNGVEQYSRNKRVQDVEQVEEKFNTKLSDEVAKVKKVQGNVSLVL